MSAESTDEEILTRAAQDTRVVLTQDLDFSRLVVLGRLGSPSVISLRLASSRVDYVNQILTRALQQISEDIESGAVVTVEDARIRRRRIPIR